MLQPLHLLDQLIVGFSEKAEDLQNTARDKIQSTAPIERELAAMYASSALTMRAMIAELIKIKAHYIEVHVDEMHDILTEGQAVMDKVNDTCGLSLVPRLDDD